MATRIQLTRSGDLLFKVWVDGEPLRFGAGDVVELEVEAGRYSLQWVAMGAEGDCYTIAIIEPMELRFEHRGTLSAIAKDAGMRWLDVG